MNENNTLLATEVLDELHIGFHQLNQLIDSGKLSPVYLGKSPFNVRAARFSRQHVENIKRENP